VDISKKRDTMKRDINSKRIGLLIVFGGIFIPIIAFLIWDEVYDPQADLYYNVQKSKLVFRKRIVKDKDSINNENLSSKEEYQEYKRYIQREISIHFKYIAAIGLIIVFLGIAVMFTEEFERL